MNVRLLVLDDEPELRESYKLILAPPVMAPVLLSSRRPSNVVASSKTPNFDVTFVDTGEKAIEAIASALGKGQQFVGGFFDVRLGAGIDGIETIRQLKDIDPEMMCVTVSAYQDRNIEEIQKIFGNDFNDRWDFLAKPFSGFEILQKANHLVANWNRKAREKVYIERIRQLHGQEELVRVAVDDVFERIKADCNRLLALKPADTLSAVIKGICDASDEARQIIEKTISPAEEEDFLRKIG